MSTVISPALQPISTTSQPQSTETDNATQSASAPITEQPTPEQQSPLIRALDGMKAYHKINDGKSLKALSHLGKSLDKAFSEAKQVDQETAEEEIKQGGLRRIGKDLRKLFKGMGLPPQAAKQMSRDITSAMKSGSTEQISFSLTTSRETALEMTQTQTGYLASGDGTEELVSTSSSLKVTALQVRSFDFSVNLATGEYSFNHSISDQLSIETSESSLSIASAAEEPAQPEMAAVESTEEPEEGVEQAEDQDLSLAFQSNRTLLEISRTIQTSALMQLQPAERSEEAEIEYDDDGDESEEMQSLVSQIDAAVQQPESRFESLTRIRNLRIETENSQIYLRFTADALAPVGITAEDESGHTSTVYTRPDGTLGKTEEAPLTVTA